MNAPTVYAPCGSCGKRMATNHDANGRPRMYCSDVCRQRVCRARHKTIVHAAQVGVNATTGGATATGSQLIGMKLSAKHCGMRDAATNATHGRIEALARRGAGIRSRSERDAARAESLKRSNRKGTAK